MPTRKPRHQGNKERTWEELNTTWGDDGRMESEAWFMALKALPDEKAVIAVLEAHFGGIDAAKRAFGTLAEDVVKRYEAVLHVIDAQEEDAG